LSNIPAGDCGFGKLVPGGGGWVGCCRLTWWWKVSLSTRLIKR